VEALTERVKAFFSAPWPHADREIAAALGDNLLAAETVAVTLLSYNRRPLLRRTLESFLACCKYPRRRLYITALDQGSTDGSLAWLEQMKDRELLDELIALPKNIGPAEGRNRLVAAIPDGIRYVFHLEDDWEFEVAGDWISPGIACLADRPECGMVRYRHKPSDHVIPTRGEVVEILDADYGDCLVSKPGGFTNTPNLGRVADYRCRRFRDPQHEYRFGKDWPFGWQQFIRVCRHIGERSAFTRADVERFDGGKRMCSGEVAE
jgi:glycosyltransferase involved in cell wall biosynthesis